MMIIIIIIELGPQINESSLWGWIDCISGGAVASLAPAETAHICSMTTTFILDFAVWNHWPAPKLTHGFPHSITDHILSIIISLQCMSVEQFTVFFHCFHYIQHHPSDERKKKRNFLHLVWNHLFLRPKYWLHILHVTGHYIQRTEPYLLGNPEHLHSVE